MINLFRETTFILILLIAMSLNLVSCFDTFDGGGGGKKKVRINGMVTSVNGDPNAVFGITIEARDPNTGKRLGKSTTTGALGVYQLKVPSKGQTRLIELFYTTPSPTSEIFSEFFIITKNSEVLLDVMLESLSQVIIDDVDGGGYQVDQKRISIGESKRFIFSGTEFAITTPQQADFTIDGKSKDCINAQKNSTLVINALNFTAGNCKVGIRANNKAIITIGAVESFEVFSKKSGIRSKKSAITTLNSGENFTINSSNAFGIQAEGQSSVIVDIMVPPVECEIFGANGDINQESSNAIISVPVGCLTP